MIPIRMGAGHFQGTDSGYEFFEIGGNVPGLGGCHIDDWHETSETRFQNWSASWLEKLEKLFLSPDRDWTQHLSKVDIRFSKVKECDMLPGLEEQRHAIEKTFRDERQRSKTGQDVAAVDENVPGHCQGPVVEVVKLDYD